MDVLLQVLGHVEKNQFLGLEDTINENSRYTMSALCVKSAEVYFVSKTDFLKQQNNQTLWKNLTEIVEQRLLKLGQVIIDNHQASTKVKESMQILSNITV